MLQPRLLAKELRLFLLLTTLSELLKDSLRKKVPTLRLLKLLPELLSNSE
jgi:hypothetical protein